MESAVIEQRRGEFVISTDAARLDVDMIYGFLTNCYWAKGIPREVVERSIEHSLCFGVYDEGKERSPLLPAPGRSGAPVRGVPTQVGFARAISDFATFAYLGDVFVLESYRGLGLGKWMMECVMKHPALEGLRRWSLVTRDAHGLYSQFGFTPLEAPERHMERHRPDVYEIRRAESGKTT
jgi:GNAT superfamily N-acetyltransferase